MTDLRRRTVRSSRLPVALAAGVVAVAALAVAVPSMASAGTALPGRSSSSATRYVTVRPECAAPRPDQATCYSLRVTAASPTTPGAQPLVATASSVTRGPAGGYTPADLASAYHYNRTAPTPGQLVAVVDAYDDPNAATDLAQFESKYGMTDPGTFLKVGQTGSQTSLPAPDRSGWSGEESLDIDAVRAVCETCNILLVEARSPSNANLSAAAATAIRRGATEVSNSYGIPERESHFSASQAARYRKRGVVVTASTGDQGWYGWGYAATSRHGRSLNSPSQPSTLPDVVAVGGTHLVLNSAGRRSRESVWNNFGPVAKNLPEGGATGGGCSPRTIAPVWQRDVAGYANTGCGRQRLAADISADADPNTGFDVYDSYDCGQQCENSKGQTLPKWQEFGGTSLSSPLIAAMWALAGGAPSSAHPARTLYQRYAVKHHPGVYDVTQGGNAYCDGWSRSRCTDHGKYVINRPKRYGRVDCRFTDSTRNTPTKHDSQCVAGKGYDGPSGIGTPTGLTVFRAMPAAG